MGPRLKRVGANACGWIAACVVSLWYVVDAAPLHKRLTPQERLDAIRRAQVWMPTNIPSMDVRRGQSEPGGFAPEATVSCDHVAHERGNGRTPKFWCAVGPDDVVKVRYREHNGKVYALVAATRLFWALGFGANRAYPVEVECRGCATDPWKKESRAGQPQVLFDPATIDRRMPGRRLETKPHQGWAWPELDTVDQAAGGAALAQRDALKLLAVFVQHTDTKAENQALICLDKPLRLTEPLDDDEDGGADARCDHPFMMVPDLGNTFGHANTFNRDAASSVNFRDWQATPIWRAKENGACVGNLSKSATGSLDNPRISEAGRRFLADLLIQLSDAQLHDLFDVARFTRRDPTRTIDDWVGVFKRKREEIVNAACAP
jgi:hypothetical protein